MAVVPPTAVAWQSVFHPTRSCRLENLNEDFDGLIKIINDRRPADQPALENEIGWKQQGPLVSPKRFGGKDGGEEVEANNSTSRHLAKYQACGAKCFDYARLYYQQDFEVLKYPAVLDQ